MISAVKILFKAFKLLRRDFTENGFYSLCVSAFFSEYNIHVSLIISEDIKGPNLAVDFSEVLLGK